MWKPSLKGKAEAYAEERGLALIGPLGNGADGSIWHVESKEIALSWALKMHHNRRPYQMERDCYLHLADLGVSEIAGFKVPALVRHDDIWRVIEMSIVQRPFILDFAQSYLDVCPDFPEEVWQERRQSWEAAYGEDWPSVRRALDELEAIGVFYLDVHHQNIALA